MSSERNWPSALNEFMSGLEEARSRNRVYVEVDNLDALSPAVKTDDNEDDSDSSDAAVEDVSYGAERASEVVDTSEPLADLSSVRTMPVSMLEVSTGTALMLGWYHLVSISDIVGFSTNELSEIDGISPSIIKELEDAISNCLGGSFWFAANGMCDDSEVLEIEEDELRQRLDIPITLRAIPARLSSICVQKGHIGKLYQLAFYSRRQLIDSWGFSLADTFELENLIGSVLGARFCFAQRSRTAPKLFVESPLSENWMMALAAEEYFGGAFEPLLVDVEDDDLEDEEDEDDYLEDEVLSEDYDSEDDVGDEGSGDVPEAVDTDDTRDDGHDSDGTEAQEPQAPVVANEDLVLLGESTAPSDGQGKFLSPGTPSDGPKKRTYIASWMNELEEPLHTLIRQHLRGSNMRTCAELVGLPIPLATLVVNLLVRDAPPFDEEQRHGMRARVARDAIDFTNHTGCDSYVYAAIMLREETRDKRHIETLVSHGAQYIPGLLRSLVDHESKSSAAFPVDATCGKYNAIASVLRAEFSDVPVMDAELVAKELRPIGKYHVTPEGMIVVSQGRTDAPKQEPVKEKKERPVAGSNEIDYTALRLAVGLAVKRGTECALKHVWDKYPSAISKAGVSDFASFEREIKRAFAGSQDYEFTSDSTVRREGGNWKDVLRRLYEDEMRGESHDDIVDAFVHSYGIDNENVSAELVRLEVERVTKERGERKAEGHPAPGSDLVGNGSVSGDLFAGMAKELSFLKERLDSPCIDADLLECRFHDSFPDSGFDFQSFADLERLGYFRNGNLLFRKGVAPTQYFRSLIEDHQMFGRGDEGFEDAVFKNYNFVRVLNEKKDHHHILACGKDRYVSLKALSDASGIRHKDVRAFVSSVYRAMSGRGAFSINSLRGVEGIDWKLDEARKALGFDQYLLESLLVVDSRINSCTLSKALLFKCDQDDFKATDFVTDLIRERGPMELEDIGDIMRDEFGIDVNLGNVQATIIQSGLYKSATTEEYYLSYEDFRERMRDELIG